jgi:hypothetical protein
MPTGAFPWARGTRERAGRCCAPLHFSALTIDANASCSALALKISAGAPRAILSFGDFEIFLLRRCRFWQPQKAGRDGHAENYDDGDGRCFCPWSMGYFGERADPIAGRGELPCAAAERDANREEGGLQRHDRRPWLRRRLCLGLRSLRWQLPLRALLISIGRPTTMITIEAA